ncbi:uncharacterized protein EI97DRAFT_98142 [Westerdykella ornata]|uniref:Uncharacterized protein n=1 Tax=Westerdykella ornata TaxID=318751 RepID=A0A6A6JEN9_WESOR|nr:uncharacterized protein EI97DRAFT_98142 [Westerdykella ornata]KAF2274735.1 hypothetical protein EI97DRAFT_98142 [Westerdykella ornata]
MNKIWVIVSWFLVSGYWSAYGALLACLAGLPVLSFLLSRRSLSQRKWTIGGTSGTWEIEHLVERKNINLRLPLARTINVYVHRYPTPPSLFIHHHSHRRQQVRILSNGNCCVWL